MTGTSLERVAERMIQLVALKTGNPEILSAMVEYSDVFVRSNIDNPWYEDCRGMIDVEVTARNELVIAAERLIAYNNALFEKECAAFKNFLFRKNIARIKSNLAELKNISNEVFYGKEDVKW